MSLPERPTIVLVDDDPTILSYTARALEALAVDVCATTSPLEAREWLATREVAALVTDYQMPMLNGVELISAALQSQPSTVRILMTGHEELATAVDAINRGEIFRYVQKPFDAGNIRAIVGDAVARHRDLAMVAAGRDQALRRARYFIELETEHPGIIAAVRDDNGDYVVPDVCNAEAVWMLGLDEHARRPE